MINKILYSLMSFVAFMLVIAFFTISGESKAFSWSDIKDAVTGHVTDVKDRLKDDQFVNGIEISKSSNPWSSDSIHYVEGSVSIVKKDGDLFVQLNEDFAAGLAPDLYIYLAAGHIDSDAEFVNNKKIELGKLIKGSGASYYKIPKFLTKYHTSPFSVVIHCKRFNEPMGAFHF